MKINTTYLFFILVFLSFGISFLSKEILKTDELLLNSLAEQLTQEQIQNALNFREKWQWVTYIIIPLLLLIKISVIALLLDLGAFFFNQEIKYKKLFNIVVKAEFVFLLVIVFKTIWLYFFKTNYSLEDLQYFYPLSMLSVIGYEGLESWYIYPFQTVNVFELAYWFILAYLLGKALKVSTEKGFTLVASSYGVGLLIWIVGVMFFTLNMS